MQADRRARRPEKDIDAQREGWGKLKWTTSKKNILKEYIWCVSFSSQLQLYVRSNFSKFCPIEISYSYKRWPWNEVKVGGMAMGPQFQGYESDWHLYRRRTKETNNVHGNALHGTRPFRLIGEPTCALYRTSNQVLYDTALGGPSVSTWSMNLFTDYCWLRGANWLINLRIAYCIEIWKVRIDRMLLSSYVL